MQSSGLFACNIEKGTTQKVPTTTTNKEDPCFVAHGPRFEKVKVVGPGGARESGDPVLVEMEHQIVFENEMVEKTWPTTYCCVDPVP